MQFRRLFHVAVLPTAAAAALVLSSVAAGASGGPVWVRIPNAAPAAHVDADSGLAHGVLAATNAIRARHGLRPLRFSPSLSAAAREHSRDMARRGYFSHSSADGSAFWKRIQRHYGQRGYGWWTVGENLLWSSPDVDVATALKMWMNSPAHRANVLGSAWRQVGISAVRVPSAPGAFHGREVTIITVDFGARH
jgi:uncharacterized protein YkwD